MFYKHFNNTTLKRGRYICRHNLFSLHFAFIQMVQYSRFNTAKAEVIWCLIYFCLWKIKGVGISFSGKLVYFWAARIAQPDGSCHFIKGFACCVISCSAQDFKLTVIFYDHQMRMTARHYQTQERGFQIRVLNIVCRNMAFYMMHSYQRKIFRKADGLCLRHSHKQRTHKPRPVSDTYGV